MQQAQVWVAYATAQQQWHIAVPFVAGMTAQQAIDCSGLAAQTALPMPLRLGIFGQKINDANVLLNAGDRVEIYRALQVNPKDIRRLRAAKHPVGRMVRRLNGVKNTTSRQSADADTYLNTDIGTEHTTP